MNNPSSSDALVAQLFFRPLPDTTTAERTFAVAGAARPLALTEAGPPPVVAQRLFSSFQSADMREANDLVEEFKKIWDVAKQRETDEKAAIVTARDAVLGRAVEEIKSRGLLLVQHALKIFAAQQHDFQYRIPTLREQLQDAGGVPAAWPRPVTPEPQMDYFRHDIDLSDHHEHWHTVYPGGKDPDSPIHGQLFMYMHQQMLARYDTERRTAGLALTDPYATLFDEYSDPVRAVPTTPVPRWVRIVRRNDDGTEAFEQRPPNFLPARDIAGSPDIIAQRASFDRLPAAQWGSMEALGRDVEGVRYYPSDPPPVNIHNNGHRVTGYFDVGPDHKRGGVMLDTATAMTDPVFYRWHRRIDNLAYAWQERQTPNSLGKLDDSGTQLALGLGSGNRFVRLLHGGGNVESGALFVVPLSAVDDPKGEYEAFGDKIFSDASWDVDPGNPKLFEQYRIGQLATQIVPDDLTREDKLRLAEHFVYFFRVENTNEQYALKVVFRLFLVSDEFYDAGDRRHVMEMDKFTVKIAPKTRRVVARPSWLSTVIRRKTVGDEHTVPDTLDHEAPDPSEGLNAWCDCGLPYRLLLPRGTPGGLRCKLILVMTDGEDDLVGYADAPEDECGSLSYCGRRAAQSRNFSYNDARAMGYPFDRPLADENRTPAGMRAMLERASNVAIRSITIRDGSASVPITVP